MDNNKFKCTSSSLVNNGNIATNEAFTRKSLCFPFTSFRFDEAQRKELRRIIKDEPLDIGAIEAAIGVYLRFRDTVERYNSLHFREALALISREFQRVQSTLNDIAKVLVSALFNQLGEVTPQLLSFDCLLEQIETYRRLAETILANDRKSKGGRNSSPEVFLAILLTFFFRRAGKRVTAYEDGLLVKSLCFCLKCLKSGISTSNARKLVTFAIKAEMDADIERFLLEFIDPKCEGAKLLLSLLCKWMKSYLTETPPSEIDQQIVDSAWQVINRLGTKPSAKAAS